jgi:biopolymer transport protein ExbD
MKNIFILISALFITYTLFADDLSPEKVPTNVQNSVMKNYKNIRDLTWEKQGKNYQAEFYIDLKEYEIIINEKGKILATYEDISITELPDKVKHALQTNYPTFSIGDVEILKTEKNQYFKVDLKNSDKDLKVFINSKGGFVKAPIFK